MKYDNYIFDLYGTLIDIRTDEHDKETWKKWCHWLDEHGIKHPTYKVFRKDFWEREKQERDRAEAESQFEVPEIDIVPVYRELFESYGNGILEDTLLEEASYAFRVASRQYARLFRGVPEYLQLLRDNGKKVYLLSNAQATYTRPEIEMFHLDQYFDDVLLSSDYACMKPDKAYFDALLDRYDMDRSKSVMHGDSASSDIAGANKAGIASVHLDGDNSAKKYYRKELRRLGTPAQ